MICTSVLLSCVKILERISERKKKGIPMLRFTRNHETMTMVMHFVVLRTFFGAFVSSLQHYSFCLRVQCSQSSTSEAISVIILRIEFNTVRTNLMWSDDNTNTTTNVNELTQL